MAKTELLAPAKDKATAFAAIDCGADAVYIGAPAFGARQNASNSLDDIQEVVNYAHKFWCKVHVTINTILTDFELDDAIALIYELYNIGVDAIIIQDMGILECLMHSDKKFPQIHISTQCDNYLPEKIKFFSDIGASRVVLARELSIEQIHKIHKECPNIELESFIHGALCVSMSGQCYLSQYIGGRSANRGQCAQPCRKQYDVIDEYGNIIAKNIYPLCLKDFNGGKYAKELIAAGVCSFKIEGRLKDINYVKNIVSYYRNLLGKGSSSGKSFYNFEPNPEKTFNRGFTDYFLNGRSECFNMESPKSRGEYIGKVIEVNREYFVIKTEKTINKQDGLYFNNDGCGVNKVTGNTNNVIIYPNKKVNITKDTNIYRNVDTAFEKELSRPVKRQIGLKIEITGNNITLIDEDGVTISDFLPSNERSKNPEKMRKTFVKQFSKTGEDDFYIENIKIASDIILPFMPVSEVNKLRRELLDKLMKKRLENFETERISQSSLKYAPYYVTNVDYRANVHNKFAKTFYEKCGVKVIEPSFESSQPKRQVELMRCKHCVKYALNMCKSPKKLFLRDSHNKLFPLNFDCKKCEMSVLSPS